MNKYIIFHKLYHYITMQILSLVASWSHSEVIHADPLSKLIAYSASFSVRPSLFVSNKEVKKWIIKSQSRFEGTFLLMWTKWLVRYFVFFPSAFKSISSIATQFVTCMRLIKYWSSGRSKISIIYQIDLHTSAFRLWHWTNFPSKIHIEGNEKWAQTIGHANLHKYSKQTKKQDSYEKQYLLVLCSLLSQVGLHAGHLRWNLYYLGANIWFHLFYLFLSSEYNWYRGRYFQR